MPISDDIQFSILDLSPSIDLPEDHILVIMRAFLDGGKELDSTQYDVATLASLYGNKSDWLFFENEWSTARWKNKHNGELPPPLHTTDAVGFTHDFKKWDATRRDKYLNDCVTVIEKSIVKSGAREEFPGLVPCTVTVVLADFKYIQQALPDGPQDASEILAMQSFYRLLEWGTDWKHAEFYQLNFDRNEPYRGHIVDRVNNKRFTKHITNFDLKRKIYAINEADSKMFPALQAADLLSWCVSHKNEAKLDWHHRLLEMRRVDEWLDRNVMANPDTLVQLFVKQARLPRRKPTR